MQKTKLWPEIKNHFGIDFSHKIPPPFVTRKFRQNRRKSIISRDICKKRNYSSKSQTIWELILLIKYLHVWWPENFVKTAVKPLFRETYAKNQNYASKSKSTWEFIILVKYLPLYNTQKCRQNRRKTIISRDMCRKRNQGLK